MAWLGPDLYEGEEFHGEAGVEGSDLSHAQVLEVEDDDDASDLGLRLQDGGQVDQVEQTEQVVRGDHRGVP